MRNARARAVDGAESAAGLAYRAVRKYAGKLYVINVYRIISGERYPHVAHGAIRDLIISTLFGWECEARG